MINNCKNSIDAREALHQQLSHQELLEPMNTLRLETLLNLSKTKVLEKLAHKYDPWQLWALLYIMNKWE